jgi:hypothetical protein
MSKDFLGSQKVGVREDLGRQKSKGTKAMKSIQNTTDMLLFSPYVTLNFFIN